jgi:integrase
LTEIIPASIERYKTQRMGSETIYGRRPTPATLNRELSCLKRMFNVTRKGLIELPGGIPAENPASAVAFLDERNIRDRVLTAEEFDRMLETSPTYMQPILLCAYCTGMRKAESLHLTRDGVDLKAGFIRLKEADTKQGERRSILIGRELRDVLQRLPLALDSQGNQMPYVFT